MKRRVAVLLFSFSAVLAGCTTAKSPQEQDAAVQADCAAKGLQFVRTEWASLSSGLVAPGARVTRECVGPGDPRYTRLGTPEKR